MLPANNLAGPAVFDFEAPAAALNLVKYDAKSAAEAIADAGSLTELYAGYGRNIYIPHLVPSTARLSVSLLPPRVPVPQVHR